MTASAWWISISAMIGRRQWLPVVLAFAVSGLASAALPAELSESESWQIHGFASQAAIITTHNNFFGHTENTVDFDFRELGINGSWLPLPNLQLSMQAIARWAGKTDDGDPRIDYGFADYSLLSDADNLWGVRVGRIMNPLGFYNDTRDVAFTRPSILLPQSIYFDANRNFALSADGAQVYGERRTAFGDFLLQLGVGLPRVDDPDLKLVITRGGGDGDLDRKPSWIGRLLYEKEGGKIRLGLTAAQLNTEYDPSGQLDPLKAGSFRFDPLILSAQYNAERWSLTGEYALRRSRFSGFGSRLPDDSFSGQSYYLQAAYRFAPGWEGVLRYDSLIWDKQDRDGRRWEALTGLPAHSRFAKDWTVGLRWDATPALMLRAEFHHVNGTGWLSGLENDNFLNTEQHWNLFAILASYRF